MTGASMGKSCDLMGSWKVGRFCIQYNIMAGLDTNSHRGRSYHQRKDQRTSLWNTPNHSSLHKQSDQDEHDEGQKHTRIRLITMVAVTTCSFRMLWAGLKIPGPKDVVAIATLTPAENQPSETIPQCQLSWTWNFESSPTSGRGNSF